MWILLHKIKEIQNVASETERINPGTMAIQFPLESLRLQLNHQLDLFRYLVVEDFDLVLVQAMLTVVGLHGSA